MAKFVYNTVDSASKYHKGEMEAESVEVVSRALSESDLRVISIDEKIAIFDFERFSEINIGGIPLKEKVIFMRQLATMLSAGVSLTNSLDILSQQIDNKGFKASVEDVTKKVTGGMAFAQALAAQKGVFDDITVSLIEAGEKSGTLEKILLDLATELESQQEFSSKVKSAMIYPIILSIVIVVVVILLMVFMVPSMKQMFSEFGEEKLPFATEIVVAISDFTLKWWPILIALVVIGFFSFRYYYKTEGGLKVVDKLVLKIPIFGKLVQKVQVATFTRTMGLLIRSGMDIVDVLNLTAASLSNFWFREGVKGVINEIKKGVPMALPLSRDENFPPLVSRMIAVGEETGKLDVVFDKLNEYYSREVKQLTENLSSIIEPVMLIIMGGAVAFIAIAIYGPMFSLSKIIAS
ncbi:type II secretion system F family protein [Candidatus Dojkabacteria bacterium]|nr:type II secretion system F family protein [Candidatus Dojkabacteria bacterium]